MIVLEQKQELDLKALSKRHTTLVSRIGQLEEKRYQAQVCLQEPLTYSEWFELDRAKNELGVVKSVLIRHADVYDRKGFE